MGSPSIPAAPAAPDYAAANREGIQTDISTLALRNSINQAAQLGKKITYIDPVDGKTERTADFTGMGNAEAAKQAADILAQQNEALAKQQLALRQKYGVDNVVQTNKELQAADPSGFQTRQNLTDKVLRGLDGNSNLGLDTSAADMAGRVRSLAIPEGTSRLASIYDTATRLPESFSDDSQLFAKSALMDVFRDYAQGGALAPDELSELTNTTRAGQVARGNFLGDAAAVAEASNTGSAQFARKQQRLQNLAGLQGQIFGQNDSLRQQGQAAKLARIGAMSGLAQQIFGNENTTLGNRMNAMGLENQFNQQQIATNERTQDRNYGRDQQALANASAMVLGNPITNQFGSLGSASTGAAPAGGGVAYQGAGQLNNNAGAQGAQFAQGNFGTLANIWGNQANLAAQGNPWMQLAGTSLGALAGGAGFGAASSFFTPGKKG